MDELLSIGEFSSRCGLSVKALRSYAEAGLLVPAVVDSSSGYRYYDPAQLDHAELVVLLRRAGIPVGDISRFLAEPPGEAIEGWQRSLVAEVLARGRPRRRSGVDLGCTSGSIRCSTAVSCRRSSTCSDRARLPALGQGAGRGRVLLMEGSARRPGPRAPTGGSERLAQRILREAGFVNVTVTGKSGDGGIDGVGVYRLSLVSFPVYFQCKRYRGTVTADAARDFRGAMVGRGEKGLLITTGSFTKDAQNEANRDGAPPVELIDGERLCDLLKDYGLGVAVVTASKMGSATSWKATSDQHFY